ncbi:hypothetical protein Q9S78_11990 [Microbacterium sp. KSW-18]|uniref:Uncharacterized protein n=1 Tax=Microbacterium aquilitoris TaxID=3067307 RepID=A0ABU3GL12_9MICO|nr:hypothetical protein [Microbacterium sp. KSW-18]MDT3331389.1 hypothetical protein [Microbacterium sp. KSW-18]
MAAAAADVQLYEAPADVTEQKFDVAMPCGCHIIQRQLLAQHKMVFFAIVWAQKVALGNLREQYSVDTGHGWFHEHVTGHQKSNDRRDLRALYSQVDVQESFDPGYDRVQDRHDQGCRGGS